MYYVDQRAIDPDHVLEREWPHPEFLGVKGLTFLSGTDPQPERGCPEPPWAWTWMDVEV